MSDAVVDVLIPVFNRAAMLKEAVASVLQQTHQDFRILVYDDGSIEPVVLPTDPRIVLRRSEKNRGLGAARNALLSMVSSPFACWLDSDDLCAAHRLERQLDELGCTGLDMVFTYLRYFHRVAMDVPQIHELRHCFATGMFVRQMCEHRFDESLRYRSEDTVWLRGLLSKGARFGVIPEPLYYYRRHLGQTTTIYKRGSKRRSKVPAAVLLSSEADKKARYRARVRARAEAKAKAKGNTT